MFNVLAKKLVLLSIKKINKEYYKTMFFTRSYHIPSYEQGLNYPLRLYVNSESNCINGQIYVDSENIYDILNISPYFCLYFLFSYKLCKLFNCTKLFTIPDDILSQLMCGHGYKRTYTNANNIKDFASEAKKQQEYSSDWKYWCNFSKEKDISI